MIKDLARIHPILLRFNERCVTVGKMNFQTVRLTDLALSDPTHPIDNPKAVVLVVDDEAVIADTLAMILEQSGVRALVAYDGKSALAIAKTVAPDLLLTDVAMPGMSGIDLAVAMRHALPKCKILLFSGQASSMDLLGTARDAGQDFTILAKPLHPTELLARVSDTLTMRTPHQEVAHPEVAIACGEASSIGPSPL
jgi:DNA-binding response OmpR family regulator